MDFVLPEPGSPEMVDLICRLEHARYELATAWCIVVADDDVGEICHVFGPFDEPEQALIEAGRQDADWKTSVGEDEGGWTYKIVPLWGPGE